MLGTSLPSVGDNVGKGSSFSTITDQTHMQARASFNISADSAIYVGQTASLFVADYLQSMSGTVTSASYYTAQNGNKICNVLITIDNPGRLTAGTAVTATIQTSVGTYSAISSTTLEWPNASNVQVKTAGTVKNLYVTANEWVEKGQLLAELESSDLNKQISDQIITIKQKQLSLNQQSDEMDKRTLYAPISGTVIDVSVTEGEEVTDNQAALVTISCLDTLQVTIPVDELDILKVKVGQTAKITSSAISGKTFTASVTKIAGEGKTTDGVSTFDVLLQLEDPGDLMAGMNVNAEIIIASKNDVLLLPIAAIQEQGGKKYVQLQTGKDTVTKLTEVEVGLSTATQVELTSGIKEGDVVIYNAPVATAATSTTTTKQQQGGMMGAGGPPQGGGAVK
jgi:HlyD family secretion protein